MKGDIEARLAARGIRLPRPATPAGSYLPTMRAGGLLHISAQGAIRDGDIPFRGKLGAQVDLEQGRLAARICGLNLIAQAKEACGGDLSRVARVVKLGGFVNCAPGFTALPQVINGASDLMVEAFGEAGRHARFAVGVPDLPLGLPVAIEAVFEVA